MYFWNFDKFQVKLPRRNLKILLKNMPQYSDNIKITRCCFIIEVSILVL